MNVVGGFCYWVDGTLGLQKQTVVGVLPTSVDGIRQLGPTVIVGSVDQQLPEPVQSWCGRGFDPGGVLQSLGSMSPTHGWYHPRLNGYSPS